MHDRNCEEADEEGFSYQATGEVSFRRKSVLRGMIFRWIGGFQKRSEFAATRVRLVLVSASTEFEVWSEYNRFARIIPERLVAGLSNKSGGVVHNNSIRIFRAHGTFDGSTAYFRDPLVLFSRTCWSLLNWRISLRDAASRRVFHFTQEKRNKSIKHQELWNLFTIRWRRRSNLFSHLKFHRSDLYNREILFLYNVCNHYT